MKNRFTIPTNGDINLKKIDNKTFINLNQVVSVDYEDDSDNVQYITLAGGLCIDMYEHENNEGFDIKRINELFK